MAWPARRCRLPPRRIAAPSPSPSPKPCSCCLASGGTDMAGLKVALLANLKKNAPHFEGMSPDSWADLDSESTIEALLEAIRAGGHTCIFREGCPELYDQLSDDRPDICFNICEGHFGEGREAQVPALLEMLRIPYTGSRVLSLAMALDKPMTKRVLMWHDLPAPAFQSFEAPDEPLDSDM